MKKYFLVNDKVAAYTDAVNLYYDGTISMMHAFATSKNADNDTYTLKNILKEDDRVKFIEAMLKKLKDHNSRDHCIFMNRDQMPKNTKTIMSIWSFKRKGFIVGRIMKYKARLYAHEGQQIYRVNYWETYSPGVNWISVRLLLTICHLRKLESESIDFVLAFPQADIEVDIYMNIPQGIAVDGTQKSQVLKLLNNIYGLKQASHNWYEMIKKGLEDRGFETSKADPCVFMKMI